MNWLLKLLGHRGREYRGDGFRVRIDYVFREVVSIIHTREGTTLKHDVAAPGCPWNAPAF
jgi:hypothetical protein